MAVHGVPCVVSFEINRAACDLFSAWWHGCIKRQDRQWPVQFGLSSRGGNPLRGARWDIWPKPKQKQWYGSIGRFWPIKGCYSQPQQCMLARLASSIMRASIWAILEFFSWVWLVDQNVNKASGEQIHRPLPLLILLAAWWRVMN